MLRCQRLPSIMNIIFYISFLLSFTAAPISASTTKTPFGEFPAECVIEHPSGTTLEKAEKNTVRAILPDGSAKLHKANPTCETALRENFNHIMSIIKKQEKGVQIGSDTLPISWSWFNFASWSSSQDLKKFTATYTIPNNPEEISTSEVLYYFIGVIDTSGNPLTILQPVLGFQGNNGASGWSIASWNCCSANQIHKSETISNLQPGDTIYGKIEKTDSNHYTITTTWKDRPTILTTYTGTNHYTWNNVALEVHNIDKCSNFAKGPIVFSKLYLQGINDAQMIPNWILLPPNGTTECNGALTIDTNTITIEQNKEEDFPNITK